MENTLLERLAAESTEDGRRYNPPGTLRGETITVRRPPRPAHQPAVLVNVMGESHNPRWCVCADCTGWREKEAAIAMAENDLMNAKVMEVVVSRGFRFIPPVQPQFDPTVQLAARQPVAVTPSGATERYAALAASVGLQVPELLREDLEGWFVEQAIDVYPIQSVEAYMNNLMLKLTQESGKYFAWHWKPVRAADRKMVRRNEQMELGIDCNVGFSEDCYTRLIPEPVLETMAAIQDRFGERVGLFITDYEERRPDPFLMVTAPNLPAYVIERWDEPSFRR